MNQQITLSQVVGALYKHKFKAFTAFVLVMLTVVALFLVWPRKYASEGRLFVQLGRNNRGLDPTPGNSSVTIQDSRETEIRSVVELMKSRAILESTVDEIGADAILESPFDGLFDLVELPDVSTLWSSPAEDGMSNDEYQRLKRDDMAARLLEKSTTVHSEKNTSVISIYVKGPSARLSQKLVDTMMRKTKEKHLEVHAIKGSTEFFDNEFSKQEKILNKAVERQKKFRDINGFLSVDDARRSLQLVINKLESDLVDAKANLAESNESFERTNQQLAEILPRVAIPKTGVERSSFEDSTTELFTLKLEAERLRGQFTANHPQIPIVDAQIAKLERELESMTTDRTENEEISNPVYEQVKVDLVRAKSKANAARARLDDLREKYSSASDEILELNAAKTKGIELDRNVMIARQDLEIFVKKRAESFVMRELDRQSISDVVVAQPGNFVVKHVNPRGSLMIPMGGLLAFLCAIGTALYYERDLLSTNLTEEEIEKVLELPVLVSLPRVSTIRNMVS